MPIPSGLGKFNRGVTNRLTKPFARRLGGFGVVRHVGRKSGRVYETPINCWVNDGVMTVALTYGSDVDWLKNLEAAGGGEVVRSGKKIEIGPPMILPTEEGMSRMSTLVRMALRSLAVTEFREFPVRSTPPSA